MHLAMVGVNDRRAIRIELPYTLLGGRLEVQLLLRVGRVGRQRVDLLSGQLQEGRVRLRMHRRIRELQLRQRDVERAVKIERVVVALSQVAAVELPGGLQLLSVARDRRVDNCGAREILLTEDAAKAIERGCLDVQREVRRTGVVERNGALTWRSGPSTTS